MGVILRRDNSLPAKQQSKSAGRSRPLALKNPCVTILREIPTNVVGCTPLLGGSANLIVKLTV